jgi:hypothetical protein
MSLTDRIRKRFSMFSSPSTSSSTKPLSATSKPQSMAQATTSTNGVTPSTTTTAPATELKVRVPCHAFTARHTPN